MTTDKKKLTHTFRQFSVNILLPVNFQCMVLSENVIRIKLWIEWYIKYCISKIFDLCPIATGGHYGFRPNGGVAKGLQMGLFSCYT